MAGDREALGPGRKTANMPTLNKVVEKQLIEMAREASRKA
jgi:hypothetical protein